MRNESLVGAFLLCSLLAPRSLAQEPPGQATAPAEDPLADAKRAFETGRYADSEKAYKRAVEAGGPGAGAAAAGLARVLEETGKIPEALEAARKASAAAPTDTDLLVLLGNRQAAGGDLEGAETTLKAAAAGAANRAVAKVALADPLRAGLTDAVITLSESYTKDADEGKAEKALRDLLAKNPWHPGALVAKARAKEGMYRTEEAADAARKALATNPSHPGAVEVLALMRYGDGDRKGAEEIVRRALAARPRDRTLLALDAVPLYLDGDAEGFEKAVGKALAVDPTFGRAYWFLSRVLEEQRRFAESAAMARRAVEVDPIDADGWFSLGRSLLDLGREKEAKEALAKAEAATPWHDIFRSNFQNVMAELDG